MINLVTGLLGAGKTLSPAPAPTGGGGAPAIGGGGTEGTAPLNSIKMAAFSNMGNMGSLVGVVGMLKLSESMNVIMSAHVAKYTIMGMTNGSITKMVFKK